MEMNIVFGQRQGGSKIKSTALDSCNNGQLETSL